MITLENQEWEHFNEWLIRTYGNRSADELFLISSKARKLIDDDVKYWTDVGYRSLYRAASEVF